MGIMASLRSFLTLKSSEGWDSMIEPTIAGERVTPRQALKNVALMRGVALLSETIAQIPLGVFDESTKAHKRDLPLYHVLSTRPNPFMTSFHYREMLMNALVLDGNFYSEIVRNRKGEVVSIWPWRPDRVEAVKDIKGNLWYRYHPCDETQEPVTLPAEDVLHFVGPFPDGVYGKSLIQVAKEAIGLTLAAERYGARWFGSGGKPDGALTAPTKLKESTINLLKKQWKDRKTDRILILEEGLKYDPFSLPPEESQFIETRKFQTVEMARILGIPPHMIGELERATFSNIEHQGINFVTYTIMPWVKRIEQEMESKILTSAQQKTLSIRLRIEGLLRGDMKSRYESYAIGSNNGFLSANDIREKEDMPPIEGGDVYKVPVNLMPANTAEDFWRAKIAESTGKGVKQDGEGEQPKGASTRTEDD